ncbi:neurosecretory protein VGF-like [Frankliniella occidentalis]|uniref:Neurosecretory protein VGF-like n=1 Tax=Frankliniella occidentalis TaxID=133901 RepID=A0A9C6XSY9_FRAOC|nr:neurosecretory protein VGF-like [Frankliniella occidentalis]
MGAGDLIVVPETATISEAAALLCRGLEESQRAGEDRLSRASSQDVIAALGGVAYSTSSYSDSERPRGCRQVDELEREKKLILDGRMSLDEAPKELVDHPVFQISQFIKNVLLGGKIPWYLQAARNHVHPARLHEMASSVSHSTSSRAILTLSRSCVASEDGGERAAATPTTLAAAAGPVASATVSTSSRLASPRANSPRDASPRDGQSEAGAAAEGTEAGGEEGGTAQEGEAEEDADVQEGVVESPEPATDTQDGEVVIQVQENDDDEEEEGDEEEEDMSGMSACDFEEDFDRQADVERGYMFTQEDFDRIKFEAESVKKMWELETVEELYALAESIVKEMVAQGGGAVPAPAKPEDRTPSPARSTKSPPPG